IIFRDLKPSNVILTTNGHLALIDFGIARHFKPGQAKDTLPFGSPGYAAPEQYGKAQTTPRADMYSLGAMLHQLLTGDDPSQSPFRFAPLHVEGQPALTKLERLIMQMVDMDASKRPKFITVVKQQLQEIAGERAISRGLPATTSTRIQPVQPARPISSSQPFGSFSQVPAGGTITVGTHGQMILVPQPTPGPGFGTQSTHSTRSSQFPPGSGRTIPQTKTNRSAIASIILGSVGFIMPFLLCAFSLALFEHSHSFGGQLPFLMTTLFVVTPSILAIIFGHIGRRRAKTIPGMQGSRGIATTGLVFGYFFTILYGGAILCLSFLLPLLFMGRFML
ncbi:MAG: protein kinase, partial [Chloroflexota bacterium]|nr:protein kinase [Chloroflexota bacterium]